MAAYLGQWLDVDSSWLQAIKYEMENRRLYIRFKDKNDNATVTARYENIDPVRAMELIEADSKGSYFHSSGLIRRPYTIVSRAK